MKYLCIGHAAYDITLPMESFPKENTKVRIPLGVECGGGAAANAAYLLSKWNMDTYFMGIVGNDVYGERIKKEFLDIGTNIDCLETTDKFHTTSAYIIANQENGSRTIILSRDKKSGVENYKLDFKPDVILVDGEELEASKKALIEHPDSISILDAGNLKEPIVELCNYVKYIVCSLDFAEEYTKKRIDIDDVYTLINAYNIIKNQFNTNVIITLGDRGSFTVIDNNYTLVPTLKIKNPVDSTAAGDIFHGAFTYFISNGYNLYDSLKYSNIAGAISVTRLGGKNSMPSLEEIFELEKEWF